MRAVFAALGVLAALTLPAAAKEMQFWNQTAKEMKGVYLAPTGTMTWGTNQTDNDPDHAVSADERLKLVGITPGRYDVKLVDTAGRTCVVHGVEVKGTGKVAFAIEEKQLTECGR